MKHILFLLVLYLIINQIVCPPVDPNKKAENKEGDESVENNPVIKF